MRIAFTGTGDIGLPSLDALIASPDHELAGVITQPDKPVGRHQTLTPPRIKVRALEAGVPVLQPRKIRDAVPELSALNADVFVVVAYGQILPRSVLDVPRLACLNIHASLLPRHRGAAPIQAAIRDGDAETGITIMWMDEGLDTGDILLQTKMPLAADETGGRLHDTLAAMAPAALMESLALISNGTAPRIPQDSSKATIVRKLESAHGHLDWSRSAVELERTVRAFDPWPGTFCLLPSGAQLKIWKTHVVEHAEACPAGGTVIGADESLRIACGSGVLALDEVQLEGRKRMSARDFLRGHPLEAGSLLK